MVLGNIGWGYCKKNRVLEFLVKIFGQVASGPLSRLNETVLSPTRFEQLTAEEDVKESANVEQYDDN